MDWDDLRTANLERVREFGHGGLDEWDAPRWFMALVGEVGELGNLLKKVERGDFALDSIMPRTMGKRTVRQEVADELADIQIYLDLLAARLGIRLDVATHDKFNSKSRSIGSDVMLP